MIGGPKKEGQTQNIRFADKAGEGSHVGAINIDYSSTRLLEASFLLAQYAFWINDHAMPTSRPVAHELTHVNERSRCRVITRLGVGCSKVSWFGRGQSQGDECQSDVANSVRWTRRPRNRNDTRHQDPRGFETRKICGPSGLGPAQTAEDPTSRPPTLGVSSGPPCFDKLSALVSRMLHSTRIDLYQGGLAETLKVKAQYGCFG